MAAVAVAIFLATVNKALVDWLVAPLKARWPETDWWWLVYVAGLTGAALGWLSGVNVFAEYVPGVLVGRVLTSLLVGGGSSLIHDLFDEVTIAGDEELWRGEAD